MTTTAVLSSTSDWAPSWGIVDHQLVGKSHTDHVEFDPQKHLAYVAPSRVYTMEEIGLPKDSGISPIAVSEPFQLFTSEAIAKMRQEVLSPEVMQNCQYSSNISHGQLRGFANKYVWRFPQTSSFKEFNSFTRYAPFTYALWKHPQTLAVISKIAGIELVTEMDLEIAHINLSVKTEGERQKEIAEFNDRAQFEADEGVAGCPWEDETPIVGWHRDSYPFVCVTMLSDCTNMVGGETALRTGSGEIMKVRGPQQVCT